MPSDIYTPDYYLEKFSEIDESKWTTGEYESGDGCKHCAMGHCGAREINFTEIHTPESHHLIQLFVGAIGIPYTVGRVNDRPSELFPQTTPKRRILAALHYIKLKQNANHPNPSP